MVITQSSTCIFPFNHGDFTLKRVNITEGDSLVSCDHVLGSEAVLCFQNKTQVYAVELLRATALPVNLLTHESDRGPGCSRSLTGRLVRF